MIDWNKAIVQKTVDLKGRKVERIIYPDEKKMCSQCKFCINIGSNRNRELYQCEKYPGKDWRANQQSCVVFEVNDENTFK